MSADILPPNPKPHQGDPMSDTENEATAERSKRVPHLSDDAWAELQQRVAAPPEQMERLRASLERGLYEAGRGDVVSDIEVSR